MDIHATARRSLILLCLLLPLLAPALSYAQLPPDEVEITGRVEARPADSTLGLWQVAGARFGVTERTVFDGFVSPPRIGDCVQARIATDGTRRLATRIRPEDTCAPAPEPVEQEFRGLVAAKPEGGASGPWSIRGARDVARTFMVSDATIFEGFGDEQPAVGTCVAVKFVVRDGQAQAERIRPADCSLPEEVYFFRGPVDSLPAEGRIGEWVIGGRTFTAVETTTFEGFASGPAVGDCVALKFRAEAGRLLILTMAPAECAGEEPALLEAAGLIEAAPEGGRFGAWTIGGVAYTARDGVTSFDERYGALEAGRCAVVLFKAEGGLRVAVRLGSREPERCTPSEELHAFFGVVERLPEGEGQLGVWVIGGRPVVVLAETKLENGPFAVGTLVQATVKRGPDGRLVAVEIEARRREGPGLPADGKAFGKIDSLPGDGAPGTWVIAGVSYTVDEQTRLRPGETPFAAGQCVEVYFRAAEGGRVALGIARAGGDDCTLPGGGEEIGRAIGAVEAMPESGFVGSWAVGGATYQVSAETVFIFQASAGSPVVGSFVELRYVQVGGVKTARAIRTITPPGLGGEDQIGAIQPATARAAAGEWTVNGVSFAITDDTMVYDGGAALAAGDTVAVNLAVDPASGARTATQVRVLSQLNTVYLPLLAR